MAVVTKIIESTSSQIITKMEDDGDHDDDDEANDDEETDDGVVVPGVDVKILVGQ